MLRSAAATWRRTPVCEVLMGHAKEINRQPVGGDRDFACPPQLAPWLQSPSGIAYLRTRLAIAAGTILIKTTSASGSGLAKAG